MCDHVLFQLLMSCRKEIKCEACQSKKGGKDQESIQSTTTPYSGYHFGK